MVTQNQLVHYFHPILIFQQIDCDSSTIHLAFMVGGAETTRQMVTLIKSILYHIVHSKTCQYKSGSIQDPLVHFHLVVDKQARVSLESLLPSWRLPRIQFAFYNFGPYKVSYKHIQWCTHVWELKFSSV